MKRLAIIDLDGVIANNESRMSKALETAEASVIDTPYEKKAYDDLYWRTAFTPDLVSLDTLIDGVLVDLDSLISAHYRIILLTSRPESMREVTVAWLEDNGIEVAPAFGEDFGYSLIMKPASQQFVKTVVWKAGIVEVLVHLFDCDELMYIDDEPTHCEAIAALNLPCDCKIGGNLEEALAMIE